MNYITKQIVQALYLYDKLKEELSETYDYLDVPCFFGLDLVEEDFAEIAAKRTKQQKKQEQKRKQLLAEYGIED